MGEVRRWNVTLLRNRVEAILRETGRAGVENLISYLASTDFYSAPASMSSHLSVVGGLAEHSLNVFDALTILNKEFMLGIDHATVALVSLGHDLCKVYCYKPGGEPASVAQMSYLSSLMHDSPRRETVLAKLREKGYEGNFGRTVLPKAWASLLIDWLKSPGKLFPDLPDAWSWDEEFPLGHGAKSTYILSRFIELKEEEALAITWHMGPYGIQDRRQHDAAMSRHPLVPALHIADMIAALLVERPAEEVETAKS